MDNFQNRIKLTRNSLGLSQAVLALKTGVSQPTVANWENGSHVPRQAVLEKISDVLGVSSSWLLTGTRNENEIPAQIYLQTPITHVPVFNWPDKPADLSSSAPTGFFPYSSHHQNLFGVIRPDAQKAGYTIIICNPEITKDLREGFYLISIDEEVRQIYSGDLDEIGSADILGRVLAEMNFFP